MLDGCLSLRGFDSGEVQYGRIGNPSPSLSAGFLSVPAPCAITPVEFLDASRAIQKLRSLDGGPSSDFADDAANERVDWESYGDAKI